MISSDETALRERGIGSVLLWCSPSLLGLASFLVSFPIYRRTPFWPHLEIAEIFAFWFVFITPVTTVVAIVIFIRRWGGTKGLLRIIGSLAVSVGVLANAFVLLGMAG